MNSFSNKYINNFNDLKDSIVGLEVEFFSNFNFIKTLEKLNNTFIGKEVWGINQYHSDFTPTEDIFKIEPDYSGGSEMIELITGPMKWAEARLILIQMLVFIRQNGYTDEHCSIHINVSFNKESNIDIYNLNLIKLLLNFNEDFIYNKFPTRRGNIYARSISQIIPFTDWNDPEIAFNVILNSLKLPDDTKYYGINVNKKFEGYLEYRYIGGTDYETKIDEVLELFDYFILQTKKAIVDPLNEEDKIKLLAYLERNINWYKQYNSYDEFLGNIDGINIQIDKNSDYKTVKMSWDKFKTQLFNFIQNTNDISETLINYNSTTNRLEIVGAHLKDISNVYSVDFIDCNISNCTLYNCDIVNSNINLGHIHNTNIYDSKIENSKLMDCKATEFTELNNCVFDGGQLNCVMKNGVFRSGQIMQDAEIDNTVKMSNKDSFWQVDPSSKKIKGLIK